MKFLTRTIWLATGYYYGISTLLEGIGGMSASLRMLLAYVLTGWVLAMIACCWLREVGPRAPFAEMFVPAVLRQAALRGFWVQALCLLASWLVASGVALVWPGLPWCDRETVVLTLVLTTFIDVCLGGLAVHRLIAQRVGSAGAFAKHIASPKAGAPGRNRKRTPVAPCNAEVVPDDGRGGQAAAMEAVPLFGVAAVCQGLFEDEGCKPFCDDSPDLQSTSSVHLMSGDNDINPASGLPMMGAVDIAGNPYGLNFNDDTWGAIGRDEPISFSSEAHSFDSPFDSSVGSSFDSSAGFSDF